MRLKAISLLLTPVLGFLSFNIFLASGAELPPPRRAAAPVPQVSEADLADRFNKVLDKELSGANVCVAPSAARKLADVMKAAAAKIVQAKAFARAEEADKNIRAFAGRLLEAGPDSSGRVRITPEDVDLVLGRVPVDPSEGGLCPLFPIC